MKNNQLLIINDVFPKYFPRLTIFPLSVEHRPRVCIYFCLNFLSLHLLDAGRWLNADGR